MTNISRLRKLAGLNESADMELNSSKSAENLMKILAAGTPYGENTETIEHALYIADIDNTELIEFIRSDYRSHNMNAATIAQEEQVDRMPANESIMSWVKMEMENGNEFAGLVWDRFNADVRQGEMALEQTESADDLATSVRRFKKGSDNLDTAIANAKVINRNASEADFIGYGQFGRKQRSNQATEHLGEINFNDDDVSEGSMAQVGAGVRDMGGDYTPKTRGVLTLDKEEKLRGSDMLKGMNPKADLTRLAQEYEATMAGMGHRDEIEIFDDMKTIADKYGLNIEDYMETEGDEMWESVNYMRKLAGLSQPLQEARRDLQTIIIDAAKKLLAGAEIPSQGLFVPINKRNVFLLTQVGDTVIVNSPSGRNNEKDWKEAWNFGGWHPKMNIDIDMIKEVAVEEDTDSGWHDPVPHKDEFGNTIKDKNYAKHLAKQGMKDAINSKKQMQDVYDTYLDNEEYNQHTENMLLLAKTFGEADDVAAVEEILAKNNKRGYTDSNDSEWMYNNIHKKFFPKLRQALSSSDESEINEAGLGGLLGKLVKQKAKAIPKRIEPPLTKPTPTTKPNTLKLTRDQQVHRPSAARQADLQKRIDALSPEDKATFDKMGADSDKFKAHYATLSPEERAAARANRLASTRASVKTESFDFVRGLRNIK